MTDLSHKQLIGRGLKRNYRHEKKFEYTATIFAILVLSCNLLFCIVILCKYYKRQPIPVYNLLDRLYVTVLTLFPEHTRTIDEFILIVLIT